jgi:hypothetical protein
MLSSRCTFPILSAIRKNEPINSRGERGLSLVCMHDMCDTGERAIIRQSYFLTQPGNSKRWISTTKEASVERRNQVNSLENVTRTWDQHDEDGDKEMES